MKQSHPQSRDASIFRALICLAAAVAGIGSARCQSLAEALDTPGYAWASRGAVTVAGAEKAFDGVDAVRLDPDPSLPTGQRSSVWTSLTQPSIVSFRHRSLDLDGMANFSVEANATYGKDGFASFWQSWHRAVYLPCEFRIDLWGEAGGNPLYLDTFSITPAPQVPLNEALDIPDAVFTSATPESAAAGISDAALSPDGVDAAWIVGGLSTKVPASTDGTLVSFLGNAVPTYFGVVKGASGRAQILAGPAGQTVTWESRLRPAVSLDQVRMVPAVPYGEALEAPGLTFKAFNSFSGYVFGTADAPQGARNGTAVAFAELANLEVSGFTGPGRLKYFSRDDANPAGVWTEKTVEVPVGPSVHTIKLKGWLDDLSFTPGEAPDVAALLGAPGANVTLLRPDAVTVTPDFVGARLALWPGASPAPTDLLRVAFPGPALISLGSLDTPNVDVDGSGNIFFKGGFSFPFYRSAFTFVSAGGGTHNLTVRSPANLHSLQVRPLEEIPLAEALDAPGMTFTTSPGTPWRGYLTNDTMRAKNGGAACGGTHPGAPPAENPWLETTVSGPGVLSFLSTRTAAKSRTSSIPALTVTLDGLMPVYNGLSDGNLSYIYVNSGAHTVRWTQPGANVTSSTGGALAWLDSVSFTPVDAVSLGAALKTGGRLWTTSGGAHAVTAAKWVNAQNPEYSKAAVLLNPSAGDGAALLTRVERPFALDSGLTNVTVSVDGRKVSAKHREAAGPDALVRFDVAAGRVGIINTLEFFTPWPAAAIPGATWGTDPVWTLRGNSMGWLRNAEDPASTVLYGPESPYGSNFLEAVIEGPFSFAGGYGHLSLPDRGGRSALGGVSFPGPNRVRVRQGASPNSPELLRAPRIIPGVPLPEATGAPNLFWETGGMAPWRGEAPADGGPPFATSGTVDNGEATWIQVTVTGPGVLRWSQVAVPPASQSGQPVGWLTLNGVMVNLGSGYLHLPAGTHRMRWLAFHQGLRLQDVGFEPAPVPSWQEVTGLTNMAFYCAGNDPLPHVPGNPPAWSSLDAWTPLTVEGRQCVRLNGQRSLIPVTSSPGDYVVTSLTRVPDPAAPGGYSIGHPWLPRTFRVADGPLRDLAGAFGEGPGVHIASAAWLPAEAVSLAEALDTPDLVWTSGSNGSGEWRGYSGRGAGAGTDPDTARFFPVSIDATAWMETTVTGPARVEIAWDAVVPVGTTPHQQPGLNVLIDGNLAAGDPQRSYPASRPAAVSVPPGRHVLRIRWGPFEETPPAAAISRVTVIPDATDPDIGALVDAPELAWLNAGLTLAAETARTRDGADALRINTPKSTVGSAGLTTTVRGPGVFRAWLAGSLTLLTEGHPVTQVFLSEPYSLREAGVGDGDRVIRFLGEYETGFLDAAEWSPLPSLSAAQALEAVTPPAGSPLAAVFAEDAVYAGWTGGDRSCVMIAPGVADAAWLRTPEPCRVSFSARALTANSPAAVSLELETGTVALTAGQWRTISFSTDELLWADGWRSLTARGGAVLIDDLTVTPYDGPFYLPWLESAGLTGAAATPAADSDGDGLGNLLEHAFGLDPNKTDVAGSPRGGASFGLPEISTTAEEVTGLRHVTVRFLGRHDANLSPGAVTYIVESAVEHALGEDLTNWTSAQGTLTAIPSSSLPGWADFVWRSAAPVTSGSRQYFRVRTIAR